MDATQQSELIRALAGFSSLLREHALLLEQDRLKSLPRWSEKRKVAFLHLRRCLDAFDATVINRDSEEARLIRREMQNVVDAEQILNTALRARRERIREKLHALRRGKSAIKGYSLNRGKGPKPKYLSSTA